MINNIIIGFICFTLGGTLGIAVNSMCYMNKMGGNEEMEEIWGKTKNDTREMA